MFPFFLDKSLSADLLLCILLAAAAKSLQSCPTLCNPIDSSVFVSKCTFCSVFFSAAAAAGAKLLQSCPTLCDPIDGSPPGSPVPGIFQARVLEWGAIAFSGVFL